MQNKKRLHKHLLVIYIIYFVALLTGFAADMLPNFSRGSNEAMHTVTRDLTRGEQRTYFVDTKFDGTPANALAVEGMPQNITARVEQLTLQVTLNEPITIGNSFRVIANNGYNYLLVLMAAAAFLTVFILIALIINSIRKSIRDEQPLRHSNILRTRWIGALLIGGELCSALSTYINYKEAARLLSGTSLEVATAFPIEYWSLIIGIFFLFMAEVLSIGTQLSEEQKFTI